MILNASATGSFTAPGVALRCALGRGGVVSAASKREGDGATPVGLWPLRRVLYRPDRVEPPVSGLAVQPIRPNDGWCDDPAHRDYNRPVMLPHPAGCERMWRLDGLYDVVVVLGHNDGQVVAGAGSAIFLHCAWPDLRPTEGCVAIPREALVAILAACGPGAALAVA